jgi:hypothetical protein
VDGDAWWWGRDYPPIDEGRIPRLCKEPPSSMFYDMIRTPSL